MQAWTEGYVADIPYSLGFYREMAPAHLAFAATCIGKHPGLSLRPRRILELGFGMGLGFVIGAASNPETHFEGIDFNPEHVAHARGLADAAGLTNITVSEASFQDLAREAREGQHDLDLIVLHGILTWVSTEAHEAIVEITRKRLRPGGLLYVSYNCMPGWAPMLPLQRLMRENAKKVGGRSDHQMNSAIDLLQNLAKEGALYFSGNPNLSPRVETISALDRSYLAHEYLNANWFVFHVADVAEMFGRAKLAFVGSATLMENMDSVSQPEAVRARLSGETDPIFRETLRDLASNKQFRRDIYGRGVSTLNPAESAALLSTMHFALAVPRSKVNFKIATSFGELEGKAEIYGAVVDFLLQREASLAEIAALPAFGQNGLTSALQTIAVLIHSGQVLPVPTAGSGNRDAAQRLNRALVEKALQGRFYHFLAAPVVGGGIQVTQTDLLTLAAVFAGHETDVQAATAFVLNTMQRLGMNWLKDGQPVIDPAERSTRSREEISTVIEEKLPVWKRLGIL